MGIRYLTEASKKIDRYAGCKLGNREQDFSLKHSSSKATKKIKFPHKEREYNFTY